MKQIMIAQFFRIVSLVGLVVAGFSTPAMAKQLYDFSRFFNEPHPFYGVRQGGPVQPVPIPGQRFGQRPSPILTQTAPGRYSGPNAVPPRARGIESSMAARGPDYRKPIGGFYGSLMLVGGYSLIDDGKLTGGSGVLTVRSDTDFVAGPGLAIGYNWQEFGWPVRTELEYHHRFRMDFGTRDLGGVGIPSYENNVSTNALLFNIYYDYALSPRWTVYGGGGIGIARNTSDVKRVQIALGTPAVERTDSKTSVSWNFGFGALWRWKENWTIDARYRFIDLGEIESGPHSAGETITAESYISHDLVIGFIYDF